MSWNDRCLGQTVLLSSTKKSDYDQLLHITIVEAEIDRCNTIELNIDMCTLYMLKITYPMFYYYKLKSGCMEMFELTKPMNLGILGNKQTSSSGPLKS